MQIYRVHHTPEIQTCSLRNKLWSSLQRLLPDGCRAMNHELLICRTIKQTFIELGKVFTIYLLVFILIASGALKLLKANQIWTINCGVGGLPV